MKKKNSIVPEKKEYYFIGKTGQAIAITAMVGFSLLGAGSQIQAYDESAVIDENATLANDDGGMITPMWGEWVCEDYTHCLGKYTPCATGVRPCEIKYTHCSPHNVE